MKLLHAYNMSNCYFLGYHLKNENWNLLKWVCSTVCYLVVVYRKGSYACAVPSLYYYCPAWPWNYESTFHEPHLFLNYSKPILFIKGKLFLLTTVLQMAIFNFFLCSLESFTSYVIKSNWFNFHNPFISLHTTIKSIVSLHCFNVNFSLSSIW